jgi:hypothetical protein
MVPPFSLILPSEFDFTVTSFIKLFLKILNENSE